MLYVNKSINFNIIKATYNIFYNSPEKLSLNFNLILRKLKGNLINVTFSKN